MRGSDGASEEPVAVARAGRVALIGRPNVGKSTLLNAALDLPLAIVSPTPQTTRDAILGIVHHGGAEIALLDTPGLHRAQNALGRAMNRSAREAARSADVIVFVTDLPPDKPTSKRPAEEGKKPRKEPANRVITPHHGDVTLLADLVGDVPSVLVINKIDKLRDKGRMLPLIEALQLVHPFTAVVPISALKKNGVERVLDEVAKLCPEGPPRYGAEELTDRPTRFFAAEYVREQILRATKEEVPHAAAVVIDDFVEPAGSGATRIDATIHIERPGQKKILVGAGGAMLKRIGTEARKRIEELLGQKVNLKLWVRVTPQWRESEATLETVGYGDAAERTAPSEPEEVEDEEAQS